MLATLNVCAQYYPATYFISPMDTPLYLSAPFGSLRDNHFHSGMDIRTYEKEGLPIYAVADGYVSRIKVSAYGYGKAIYIDHPNGYTSVYGHLQKYNGDIAQYVKTVHYTEKSFEIDHFPNRNKIKVNKGQIIGFSGNSGGSTGPHLHFEIRNTKAEEPINPQLFGITGIDFYEPVIKRLVVYNLNNYKPIIQHNIPINERNSIKTDSGFVLLDTIKVAKGAAAFGIEAYDYLLNEKKAYSIYCSDFYWNKKKYFTFRMDRLNFSETKFINAHIDYELYKRDGIRIQKCFLDDGNGAQIYPFMRNKGIINLEDTMVHTAQFCVGDFDGRVHTIYVKIKSNNTIVNIETPCNDKVIYPNINTTINDVGLKINIPSKAVYDTLYPCIMATNANIKGTLSMAYQVHTSNTPLHKPITIAIQVDTTAINTSKLLIASVKNNKDLSGAGGEYQEGWVTFSTSNFGTYAVVADTTMPTIKVLGLSKTNVLSDTSKFQVKISDNMSGIATYTGTLNGKWILLDYDAKNDLLQFDFDETVLFNQKQELQIIVTDKKGNTNTWKSEVTFKK